LWSERAATRDPIAAAAAWVMAQFIAGLAVYGEATYPGLFIPGEPASRPAPGAARLASRSGGRPVWSLRQRLSRWRGRIRASLVILWLGTGRGPQVSPAFAALEALDDRTLRDIGLCRDQLEHAASLGEHRG
jgi:uncharacterized protein YjiS (DUF1127 family)